MPMNKDLKNLLSTKNREGVLGSVEAHLLTRKPDLSRRRDVLHPSQMVYPDWCPRAAQWEIMNPDTVVPERHGLRMSSIFAEGHYIHHKWQSWLGDMGILYGAWRCSQCGWVGVGQGRVDCSNCLLPCDYREVPLDVPHLHMSGHADGIVCVSDGRKTLLEIKSIGTGTIRMGDKALFAAADGDLFKAWRSITRPFIAHVRQAQIYAHLLQLSGGCGDIPAVDDITVLYELKADQDAKEFKVPVDFSLVEGIFEHVEDIAWEMQRGNLVPCPHKRCAKCSGVPSS